MKALSILLKDVSTSTNQSIGQTMDQLSEALKDSDADEIREIDVVLFTTIGRRLSKIIGEHLAWRLMQMQEAVNEQPSDESPSPKLRSV